MTMIFGQEECEEEQVQFDRRHGFNESTSFVMYGKKRRRGREVAGEIKGSRMSGVAKEVGTKEEGGLMELEMKEEEGRRVGESRWKFVGKELGMMWGRRQEEGTKRRGG